MMDETGQLLSHSRVGPIENKLMRPDITAANMNVMNTCDNRRNFLLIF